MSKNECGKTRSREDPYEVWTGPAGFEWRVLKKYQKPELEAKNKYARWFCAVKSDMTYGSFELGDVYVSEIKEYGVRLIQAFPIGNTTGIGGLEGRQSLLDKPLTPQHKVG